MQKEVKINNHKVDNALNEDFIEIISCNSEKMTPYMKLFLEQQRRLFTFPSSGARYYPMVIRFCLYVAA